MVHGTAADPNCGLLHYGMKNASTGEHAVHGQPSE